MMICELFVVIAERFATVYGAPLKRRGILQLGGVDDRGLGWHVKFNTGLETEAGIGPVEIRVEWNGWPAGIIDPAGGCLAAGDAANETSFRKWLETADRPKEAEVK